jgi:hypothetical protein
VRSTWDLDGVAIGPLFTPFSSAPAWQYARMNIAEGEHVITSNLPFQAQASGFGDYNSYAFFTGFTEEGSTGLHPAPAPSVDGITCIVTSGPLRHRPFRNERADHRRA